MVEFVYNNVKIMNISYIIFKFNYKYYFYIFYEKDFDFYLKLKAIKELFFKL